MGPGAGLPSNVGACLGARRVVVTDISDPDLLETMWRNVRGCELLPRSGGRRGIKSCPLWRRGWVWGADPGRVLGYLGEGERGEGFDVLVLADLLFPAFGAQEICCATVRQTLKKSKESKAFVVFTSYRPWLQHKDLAFFDVAREEGWVVEKVLEKKMDRPLFEKDPGDEEILKTVTGWELRWPEEALEEGDRP
ncbi:hypothetical protein CHGG_08963 [Chaetomium globosum CBS 148.51]|uniref:Nicotinamide N-methyltransferase n=1 Tax=Chaetomium globosum (strain ATCC 6205 / CBS 148.51 / DSM 1962 / NBRC 6347 / NRRL 1970) TaxID=306901 RepID=Q2GSU1_CHAGB|nr:uncharacterized protein CHGG_08963 [Chaetomium globosum CBS 148.51]EAQ84949.1 hypothetical protein CHGG_08963 [Chaetomium globosum CBS 148.51]